MDVLESVASRYSCRASLPTPVLKKIVREIVEQAARAPSAGNMQPSATRMQQPRSIPGARRANRSTLMQCSTVLKASEFGSLGPACR